MDDIGIQVSRWINIAEKHWEGLRGAVLRGSHIGGAEPIAAGHHIAHVEGVRDLEVVAQSLVEHDFGAFEGDGLEIWGGESIHHTPCADNT